MNKHTTKKKMTEPVKRDPNIIQITRNEYESIEKVEAEISISTTTLNAITARSFSKIMGVTDITETISVMQEKASKVNAGDLTELEATLTAQSVTLDTMFNELARRAVLNMGEHLSATETYMRLALKAQSQCARTIEVLAAMKNPPIVYAKQANIAHGNQQVNNATNRSNTHTPAHAEKIINQPNNLLEVNHGGKEMDGRTAQTTIPEDKAMATVAAQ
ncbi:MAG: hypothetical protein V9G21_03875 [Methylotenera sp.]